jgi:tRNA pseudouridine55 synthase
VTSGLVLIDKPTGWTSHDVVAKVRRTLGTKKVGHAGTLDPLATGLLVLGVNSGTKLLTFLVGADKRYEATIRLGQSTISDDSESEILTQALPEQLEALGAERILAEIEKLTGEIQQRPSSVSAIKVEGKRAYDLVRQGEDVNLKPRNVTVSKFSLVGEVRTSEKFVDLDVSVDCSSGTYIRALARDLGEALSVGGHLVALRRTRVGGYSVDQANTLVEIENLRMLPLSDAASSIFSTIQLSASEILDLVHGKRLKNLTSVEGLVAGVSAEGKLVAVLESHGSTLKSVVVFQGEING